MSVNSIELDRQLCSWTVVLSRQRYYRKGNLESSDSSPPSVTDTKQFHAIIMPYHTICGSLNAVKMGISVHDFLPLLVKNLSLAIFLTYWLLRTLQCPFSTLPFFKQCNTWSKLRWTCGFHILAQSLPLGLSFPHFPILTFEAGNRSRACGIKLHSPRWCWSKAISILNPEWLVR